MICSLLFVWVRSAGHADVKDADEVEVLSGQAIETVLAALPHEQERRISNGDLRGFNALNRRVLNGKALGSSEVVFLKNCFKSGLNFCFHFTPN